MLLRKCYGCGYGIKSEAEKCPNCGVRSENDVNAGYMLLIVLAVLFIAFIVFIVRLI